MTMEVPSLMQIASEKSPSERAWQDLEERRKRFIAEGRSETPVQETERLLALRENLLEDIVAIQEVIAGEKGRTGADAGADAGAMDRLIASGALSSDAKTDAPIRVHHAGVFDGQRLLADRLRDLCDTDERLAFLEEASGLGEEERIRRIAIRESEQAKALGKKEQDEV